MTNYKKYLNELYKKNADTFYKELKQKLKKSEKTFIVTANPETISYATTDKEIQEMVLNKEIIKVPDGIGVVKAAKLLNINIEERIPGIEIAEKLLEYGNELSSSIYLFGAKKEVLYNLNKIIKEKYPNIKILGMTDGYAKNKEKAYEKIIKLEPDIILVALGIPNQEKLIYKYLEKFNKGIFVGVGGSFDVLSGSKKRAPKLFQKLNIEWLYRIIKEPSRLKRFYENNTFNGSFFVIYNFCFCR